MRRLRSRILHLVAAAFVSTPLAAASGTAASPLPTAASVYLHCTILDADEGTALPTRCKIVDAAGVKWYPNPMVSLYHSAAGGYFYADGAFTCAVPAGGLTLTLRNGFEYREAVIPLHVTSDTSIVFRMKRFVSMNGLGWYSGDTHTHLNHVGGFYPLEPDDALLVAGAEGLNLINCLDNAFFFTGAPAACSTPGCVVYMSEEMRSSSYGHYGLLGLRSLVMPTSSIWWPLAVDIADSTHAQEGALVVSAHPASSDDFTEVETWPGSGIARELPIDCISRRIDAMDVMSYSNFRNGGTDMEMWYRLLNCGHRVAASAGTDAAVNRLDSYPPGGFRVYVRVADEVFSADGWFEGLAAGRAFITNGPLVTRFEIGAHGSGDSCSFAHPGALVTGSIAVESAYPIDRIEIVRNGGVERTIRLLPSRISVDTSFSLTLDESSWIAARVVGARRGWIVAGDSLYAHTNPVFCAVAGRPILVPGDAAYLAQWIADLDLLARVKGVWADSAQASRVFGELAAAKAWYEERASGSVVDAGGGIPDAPPLSCRSYPNPFSDRAVIDFEIDGVSGVAPGGGSTAAGRPQAIAACAVYDVSGRLVRRFAEMRLDAGNSRIEWDGRDGRGRPLPSGIYFAKISAGGRIYLRKMVLAR